MNSDAFIDDLIRAVVTPQARLGVLACMAKYAGQSIYIPVESKLDRRIKAAGNMLRNGMEPAEVATALVTRFGISLRTAQRNVTAARKLSSKNVASD